MAGIRLSEPAIPRPSASRSQRRTQANLRLITWNSDGQLVSSDASSAVYGSPYILRAEVTNNARAFCLFACATGSVTLSDGGSALDSGTYTLNNLGFTEDQSIELTTGSHALGAQYVGDNSYNPSAVSKTITVTRAPTTISDLILPSSTLVGNQFRIYSTVLALSYGAVPGGTMSFKADGAPLTGTLSSTPIGTSPDVETAFNFVSSITSSGNKTITATYDGDSNYASSSSTGQLSVLYPTNLSLSADSFNPSAGQSVVLTALVRTHPPRALH